MTSRAELRVQGAQLTAMREAARLTKTSVACRTKIPRSNLVRWEQGRSDIPAGELKRLMNFYARVARKSAGVRGKSDAGVLV